MQLIYGNPTLKVVTAIRDSILVREWTRLGVFEPLKGMMYPDEETTKQELVYMLELQKNVDSMRLERIQRYDATLYETMVEFLGSYGVSATVEEIKQQLGQYEPVV